MNILLNTIRKLARFLLAIAFWLHALFLLEIPLPSPIGWHTRLHLESGEAWVIALIATLSILLSYGLAKLSLDVAYIYLFPFIAPVQTLIVGFKTVRGTRRILGFGKPRDPQLATAPTASSSGAIVPAQPQKAPSRRKSFLGELLRPFRQFTLLWCLLLLLSSNRWVVRVALFIVLCHLMRLLFKVTGLTIVSVKWLAQLDAKIKTYAEGLIGKVLAISAEGDLTQDLKNTVLGLFSLRTAVNIMRNRAFLVQAAGILGILLFGIIYLYLAFVFAFAYYGLARVQSIPYTRTQALISSVFIPVAFGDLPMNPWIKLIGGFHWLFVFVLGVGTVVGYFQRKLETLRGTAEYLNERLEDQKVKTHLDILIVKAKPSTPEKSGAPK